MDEQRFPVNIQIVGLMHKASAKMYMTTVLWSDQNEITVYRSLDDYKALHKQLKKKFLPSNPFKRSGNVLPKFRASRVQRNATKLSLSKSVEGLKALEEYCSELLKSEPQISQSSELIQFLLPKAQDLSSDFAKNSIVVMPSETSLVSSEEVKEGVTQPFITESYRCVATFETKDTKNRPFKVEVDEKVDVLIKDQKGWWLVENEDKQIAWFPAPYLERLEMDGHRPDMMDGGSVYYVAVKTYKAMNSDEISVEIGSVVEVLQKSNNGWWIIRYNKKAGYVPSMYLQPHNNPRALVTPTLRARSTSTLDLGQLCVPGDQSPKTSGHEISRSQSHLLQPGSFFGPRVKRMSRSVGLLPDPDSALQSPPTIRVQFAEEKMQRNSSEDSEFSFSDDNSSFDSNSLSCSNASEVFRQSVTPTPSSPASLSPETTTDGEMTSSSSDPCLNKQPSSPTIPPRPQTQEILQRCTTLTRKNLQRTN